MRNLIKLAALLAILFAPPVGAVLIEGYDATTGKAKPVNVTPSGNLQSGTSSTSPDYAVAVPLGPQGAATGNVVALSTTSAQSAAITGSYVDLICSADCFVEIGSNPTAVSDTSYYMAGGVTYRFPITSGNKIAAKVSTGTASLWWHAVQ